MIFIILTGNKIIISKLKLSKIFYLISRNKNTNPNKSELSNKNISLLIPKSEDKKPSINSNEKDSEKNIGKTFEEKLQIKKEEKNNNLKSNFSSNSTDDSHYNLLKDLTNPNYNQEIHYNEGYLYKITNSNKIKKLFFKLIGKDFYCNF